MTSRKRNKGKERKAKNAKKEEERARSIAHGLWHSWTVKPRIINDCDHGCDVTTSDDHPVSQFMDKLFICWLEGGISANNFAHHLREILELHRELLNNETYLKLSINILIKIS